MWCMICLSHDVMYDMSVTWCDVWYIRHMMWCMICLPCDVMYNRSVTWCDIQSVCQNDDVIYDKWVTCWCTIVQPHVVICPGQPYDMMYNVSVTWCDVRLTCTTCTIVRLTWFRCVSHVTWCTICLSRAMIYDTCRSDTWQDVDMSVT